MACIDYLGCFFLFPFQINAETLLEEARLVRKDLATIEAEEHQQQQPQELEASFGLEPAPSLNAEAEQLLQESSELREEVARRELAIQYLAKEAEQLEGLAAIWAGRVKELETIKFMQHEETQVLRGQADQALADADRELEVAEEKRSELAAHPSPALQVEAAALAERADIKARGAELELIDAMRAASREERIESALTQARRDAELLLRRAGELLATAETYMEGQDALLERAYEKACRAYDLSQESVQQQQGQPLRGEGHRGRQARDATRQRYEIIKAELAESELHASELLAEARK